MASCARGSEGAFCHFARLPQELRDRIYDFTCRDTTSLVLVSPTLFTQILFTGLPETSLLRVCRPIRQEVLLCIARRTWATTLDAWDCQGAYDPLQRKNRVPAEVLEAVSKVEVLLPTWTPVDNDLALVEAVLNYVRGVQDLAILFNNPSLAQAKIQELRACNFNRAWNAGTQRHDLQFRRLEAQPLGIEDGTDEEFLSRGRTTKTRAVATVVIKTYVSGRWTEEGIYVPGHYIAT